MPENMIITSVVSSEASSNINSNNMNNNVNNNKVTSENNVPHSESNTVKEEKNDFNKALKEEMDSSSKEVVVAPPVITPPVVLDKETSEIIPPISTEETEEELITDVTTDINNLASEANIEQVVPIAAVNIVNNTDVSDETIDNKMLASAKVELEQHPEEVLSANINSKMNIDQEVKETEESIKNADKETKSDSTFLITPTQGKDNFTQEIMKSLAVIQNLAANDQKINLKDLTKDLENMLPVGMSLEKVISSNTPITSTTVTTPVGPASSHISVPLDDKMWGAALAEKVVWLTQHPIKTAAIHLNPPELGPLNIHIKMDSESASVYFNSQHGVVREAIEQALPKLRELMNMSGVQLGNVNVSDQSPSQFSMNSQGESQDKSNNEFLYGTTEQSGNSSIITNLSNLKGIIDYYV